VSGVVDLPTLDLLRSFRSGAPTTEPLAFGVYAEVLRRGVVEVGEEAVLADQAALTDEAVSAGGRGSG
jgi:hypothetical protein